jgi:hypothetical protein
VFSHGLDPLRSFRRLHLSATITPKESLKFDYQLDIAPDPDSSMQKAFHHGIVDLGRCKGARRHITPARTLHRIFSSTSTNTE